MHKVLFGVPRFTAELTRTDLAPELPGWEITVCPRRKPVRELLAALP